MNSFHLEIIRKAIISKVFITKNEEYISKHNGGDKFWLFDFRRVMLTPDVLDAYASLFMETYKNKYPFQVCGLEVAAIPLISAIVMKSQQLGMPVNGFFIRKSRKKSGLLKMVEGTVADLPVILVDDLINSGSTFIRLVEVLEGINKEINARIVVRSLSVILQFREPKDYLYFSQKGIAMQSFFRFSDFSKELPEISSFMKKEVIPQTNFTIKWSWKGKMANYWYVGSKCQPLFFENRVYVGTDDGVFYCFNGDTGETVYMYRVPLGNKKRKTFSSPIIVKDLVIFGAHDGNLYALDRLTGKRAWVFMEGDYIDTQPCSISKHGTIVTGVELGLFKKKSSLVCVSVVTGKKEWGYVFESSLRVFPVYHKKSDSIFVTTEDGSIYTFNAKNGACLWNTKTDYSFLNPPSIDEVSDSIVAIGMEASENSDSGSHMLTWKVGNEKNLKSYPIADFSGHALPVISQGSVIITSLDKTVRAYSLLNGEEKWKTDLGSRIFSAPVVCYFKSIKKSLLYVGTNNGHLFEINQDTGEVMGKTIVTERITDRVTYDPEKEIVYLTTYANELYALMRKEEIPQ